ncbi:ATP-binding cassette sub-family G member 1 [Aethina tumida]|uniref:ATP-binding cassette sub-family G member 1 n=1 Tax=Aethina tumida TaxID=116153 RepID=UPI00096ADC58|nr:ATP-binding cassette sub-family G member 1 [Aethina tumida]
MAELSFSAMDTASAPNNVSRLKNKRPDSQRIELLTIPENECVKFGQPEGSVNVAFQDLSYSVTEGIFRRKHRQILKGINGEFNAGELTAIMGPSGSGKSTLMNILAGYITKGVVGKLLVNDELRDESSFRKQSCYIMQDDSLQPLLTVNEAMSVAANLKMSSSYNHKEKQQRAKEILESIGLWEQRGVKTQALSGGQKKRLSIALELLKNPQVMFFDEPTSGLDSLTSKQCIMLLKQIAATGRTVICTIHQPSAMLFEMFDHLYVLATGKCLYQGSIKGLLPYLEEVNLRCPSYHNPADYLLEVASGEYGDDYLGILSNKSDNGMNSDWRKKQRNSLQFQSVEHIEKIMESGRITPVNAPPIIPPKFVKAYNQYPTSFLYQLYVLLKRTFLILSRDRTLTYSRLGTHTGIALVIGILYYGIGIDASNMLNNFNFIFFSVMFLMLTAFNCVTTTFPSEVPIITREHFNKWYSLKSYYLAISLADIPIQVAATLIYSLVTYFLTQQPYEIQRILSYIFICILISLVAQSFGLLIGACMDIKNGVIFGPLCFLPFTIFSGFFVQLHDAHPYMRWLFHISYLRYGFEGLVLSVLENRDKLPCNADYCHFVYPNKFLEDMDMQDSHYSIAVIFLLSLFFAIRLAAYFALIIKVRMKRS